MLDETMSMQRHTVQLEVKGREPHAKHGEEAFGQDRWPSKGLGIPPWRNAFSSTEGVAGNISNGELDQRKPQSSADETLGRASSADESLGGASSAQRKLANASSSNESLNATS